MADYLTTWSGIHFTPLEPKKEEIRAEDIAHALSLMTRANGHFPEFYSVAQHCIHCCEEPGARSYSARVQAACLLHDGSEAYLADITRPVKKHLPGYLSIEEVLQSAIYEKFLGEPLTEEEEALVKDVDDALLYYEFLHYMGEALMDCAPVLSGSPVFETLPFQTAEKRYLKLLKALLQEQGLLDKSRIKP